MNAEIDADFVITTMQLFLYWLLGLLVFASVLFLVFAINMVLYNIRNR